MNRFGNWGKLKDSINSAVEKSETAKRVMDAATSAATQTQSEAMTFYAQGMSKLFPECPVTAFMLPIGSAPDDYVILFNLDETFDNLRAGLMVQPKMEVWAARNSGYDLERFGQRLKQDFVRQFNETRDARESQIQSGQDAIVGLESDQRELVGKLWKSAGKAGAGGVAGIVAAVTLTGLISLPLLPMILLGLALGIAQERKLASLMQEYMSLNAKKGRSQRELDQEIKDLESQFDSHSESFKDAIGNIEVKVHPRLREIAEMICEVESVPFFDPGSALESANLPDVEPFLRHSTYMDHLPDIYWRLVDSDANTEDSESTKRNSLFSRIRGRS